MNNIYKILIRDSSKKVVDDFDFRMWKNNNSKKIITNKCPYCESKKIIKWHRDMGVYWERFNPVDEVKKEREC